MGTTLTFRKLHDAVSGQGVAFRTSVKLQPAAGEGTKVFPPTYAGGVYAKEKRRLPGRAEPVDCVLIDSVQSQANRMEEALQAAIDQGRLKLPLLEVDFGPFAPDEKKTKGLQLLDPVGKVSTLQVPHRAVDAIFRESLLNGVDFRASEVGKRISSVRAQDATALYEYCPTALVFGIWDSTGPKGGLGAKFERAIVGEIVGLDAVIGEKTSSRIDPIIRKNPAVFEARGGDWTVDKSLAATETKKGVSVPKPFAKKLSKLNLGNVAPSIDLTESGESTGGVTIAHAEQTIVLSLPALRRLRFPRQGQTSREVDDAARSVLAALGLCASALAAEAGLDLRSRCLLWPTEPLTWQLLGNPGVTPEEFTLEADAAIKLLNEAVAHAEKLGLKWHADKPLTLTPSDRLLNVVIESQKLAVKAGDEKGTGEEGGE